MDKSFDVYHDESKADGYWHGILLVPQLTRPYLLRLLEDVRKNLVFDGVLTFKGLNARKVKRTQCGANWITIGAAALMQGKKQEAMPAYRTGKLTPNNTKEIKQIDRLIKAKFILFRDRQTEGYSLKGWNDGAVKTETIFGMALKGGMHLLGSDDAPINLHSLHFDGHEHLRRHIDRQRILNRLSGLRGYCSIGQDIPVDDRSSSHHRSEAERQTYDDCQLLQLTDLLIGSCRLLLSGANYDHRANLVKPFHKLVADWKKGPARMRNSRWYQGYCLSECWLEDNKWNFGEILVKQRDSLQLEAFLN